MLFLYFFRLNVFGGGREKAGRASFTRKTEATIKEVQFLFLIIQNL